MTGMRAARLALLFLAAGCASVKVPPPAENVGKTEERVATAPAANAPASPAPPAATVKKEAVALVAPVAVAKPAPAVAAAKPALPAPAVAAAKPTAAPLDLKLLETRLKETPAIGVFTKLSLKNQVDDLLNQFRAYYKGALKTTLAELRRPYEMLLLKVLSLLQDADPPLAQAIVASREAIWGILADPVKFSAI